MNEVLTIIDKYLADHLLESSNPRNTLNRMRKEIESLGQIEPLVRQGVPQPVQTAGQFNVWMEGYAITGNNETAQYLGRYEAETFKDACKIALSAQGYDLKYYDEDRNTHWGCRLYDNEDDARKGFG